MISFPVTMTDALTLLPIFLLVTTLFYLSHRETRKSLGETREAHALLSLDRQELIRKLGESNRELHETQVKRLNELTEAAEFGRMAQGLFHDLITPLTSLILQTGKLKDKEKAQASIDKTIEASERMAKYVKDMRATLSQEETRRECVLSEELESVLHFLHFKIQEKNIAVKIEAEEDTKLVSSPTKLRQLFSNLISNAIDAFDEVHDGRKKEIGILIKKEEGEKDKEKNSVKIIVQDNGIGIRDTDLPHIFEPFYTTKPSHQGTGIGLVTVKDIAERDLGGTIEVESARERGTKFTITFPRDSRDPVSYPPRRQK